MKKSALIILTAGLALSLSSCSDLLDLESKVKVTNNYLYTSADGLQRAVAGLYVYERDKMVIPGTDSNGEEKTIIYQVLTLDYNTDLTLFRAGSGADIARLDKMTSSSEGVETFWKIQYNIIGKANEIIEGCKSVGLDDPAVAYVYAEASLFRGRAFFELYKRFSKVYLNLVPTTADNINREYAPASKEELFAQIDEDLENAIAGLDWSLPASGSDLMYGRFTKAVAKHVRAQVAMWEEDWDKAIKECEDIFTEGSSVYGMMPTAADVFADENLRNKEVLFAYQFSKNIGGGGTVSGTKLVGHTLAVNTTPQYRSIPGCQAEAAQGGYGFGRVMPNSYLLGLYDKDKDNRYNGLFRHTFTYNVLDGENYGEVIDPEDLGSLTYERYLHPMCIKHADFWTNQDEPTRNSSFRDLIVYRLAETYLMCCEAYYHRDGGASEKAVEYFNETYVRAGNEPFTGTLSLDNILDEYARELCWEGVRWPLLKRLGVLGERAILHAGDTMAEEPLLSQDYAHVRDYFEKGKHENWPIPANQLLLMGDGFPQNDNWN